MTSQELRMTAICPTPSIRSWHKQWPWSHTIEVAQIGGASMRLTKVRITRQTPSATQMKSGSRADFCTPGKTFRTPNEELHRPRGEIRPDHHVTLQTIMDNLKMSTPRGRTKGHSWGIMSGVFAQPTWARNCPWPTCCAA